MPNRKKDPLSLRLAGWVLFLASGFATVNALVDYYKQHTAPLIAKCTEDTIVLSQAKSVNASNAYSLNFISPKTESPEITDLTQIELRNAGDNEVSNIKLKVGGLSRFVSVTATEQIMTTVDVISNNLQSSYNRDKALLTISGFPPMRPGSFINIYIYGDRYSLSPTGGIDIESNAREVQKIAVHSVAGTAWILANMGFFAVVIGLIFWAWNIAEMCL
jgi:hypothetical protein